MADENTVDEPKLDEEGNPIVPDPIKPEDESGTDDPLKTKSEDDKDEDEDDDKDEPQIPVRNSAAQVIARQKRTIKKLRSKDEEDESADYEPPTGDDDNDDLTPEAQTAVTREVQRQLNPVMSTITKRTDEEELQGLFSSDPESKTYEKRIRAYMKSSHYKGVPPSVIYHHLAFDDAETTGSRKKKTADIDAEQQRGGGSSRRPVDTLEGGVPSVEEQNEMSDKEFEKLEQKARSGAFLPQD